MKRILGSLLALVLWVQTAPALDIIQNVARSFMIEAPALDKTDGVTPETSLTPSTFVVWKYPKNKAPVSVTITTAVNATSTITTTGAFANNDTITFTGTLDGTLITETYTWKTTLTGAANEIKASTVAATDLDNLKCAINDNNTGCATGEGTDYGTGTVASVLVNATTNAATTQLVVANIPGTLGNSFTTAESGTGASWTGSTLSGGVDGMLHANVGYYWFCQPATFWADLGDGLLTFNYAAEAAPFFQRYKVVANASNEIMVQGLGATIDGLLETQLSTVGDTTSWAYKLNNLDIVTSAVWDQLYTSHVTADTFGARLALTTVDNRPIVVDAAGLVDGNAVKIGPTGAGTAQTSGDIIGDTNDIQARLPAALGANGNIKADVRDYNGTAGTFSGGRPEVNVSHWKGTAAATVDTAGYPVVTIKDGTGQGELATGSGTLDNLATESEIATEVWGTTFTELLQATPSATPNAKDAIMALYMALRNSLEVTATVKRIKNDAGTTIFKKTLSDNGTTYTEAEAVAGP